MIEQFLATNKYQQRLESAQQIADYDGLSDDSKAVIAQLAYDKNLDGLGFNEVLNAELIAHRRKLGNSALARVVEQPQPTVEQSRSLPRTFEEAYTHQNTYEDSLLRSDVSENNPDDIEFYSSDALQEHMVRLHSLTDKYRQQYGRGNAAAENKLAIRNNSGPWVEHFSLALAKEKSTVDEASSRIYLNPKLQDSFSIYQEIFLEANRRGLRFQSKIFDPSWYRYKSIDQAVEDSRGTRWARRDPIVFYPFEESKDELLAIVNDTYEKHADSFMGRETGSIPTPLAPGLAVGDNVTSRDANGIKESLTTHRGNVFDRMPSGLTIQQRRQYLIDNHINPDNIAFNAQLVRARH